MMSPSGDSNKTSSTNNGASNKKRISENACDGYFKKAKMGDGAGGHVSSGSICHMLVHGDFGDAGSYFLNTNFAFQGGDSPNQSIPQGGEDSNSTSFSLDESSNSCVNIDNHKNSESAGSQLVGASNSSALTKEVCHMIAVNTERLCLNQCM